MIYMCVKYVRLVLFKPIVTTKFGPHQLRVQAYQNIDSSPKFSSYGILGWHGYQKYLFASINWLLSPLYHESNIGKQSVVLIYQAIPNSRSISPHQQKLTIYDWHDEKKGKNKNTELPKCIKTWYSHFSDVENDGLNLVLYVVKHLDCMTVAQYCIKLTKNWEQNKQTY